MGQTVDVGGVSLWYETHGGPDGASVVLVNGATATAVWWPTALIDALVERGLRAVVYDHRDIGLSTHVDYAAEPYLLGDLAADLIGLITALELGPSHLVGVSMGGMVAQHVALARPDLVRSLTLIASSGNPVDPTIDAVSPDVVEVAGRAVSCDAELRQREIELGRLLAGPRYGVDEEALRLRIDADAARGTHANSAHALVTFTSPPWHDRLGEVTAPTVVVHGTADPAIPFAHGEALVDFITDAELIALDGVGHEIRDEMVPDLVRAILGNVERATDRTS